MLENYVGPRREEPLHATAQQRAEAENTAENKEMQQDAEHTGDTQLHAPPSPDDFTISVEQVREHFRSKGLSKSKDTVQRWCRTGELACKKRGVLNRYFTTEASLQVLEKKLLPDMIAENSGGKADRPGMQLNAATQEPATASIQLYEGSDTDARSGTQQDEVADVQLHSPERADSKTDDVNPQTNANLSRLQAENEGLRSQLENRDSQIEFLQEEVRSAREQRSSVVQISNRMLETLETMAIGGRLERPKQSEPVRYEAANREVDEV